MCRYAWWLVTVLVLDRKRGSSMQCVNVRSHCACAWPDGASQSCQAKEVICVCACVCCGWSPWETSVQQHPTPSRVPAEWGNLCAGQSNKNATAVQKDMAQIIIENLHVIQSIARMFFHCPRLAFARLYCLGICFVSSRELDTERTSPTALG